MDNPNKVIYLAVVFVGIVIFGLRSYHETVALQIFTMRESHENELERLHAKYEAEILKRDQLTDNCNVACEKRVSKIEDNSESELQRQRTRFERDIQNSEGRTKDCHT